MRTRKFRDVLHSLFHLVGIVPEEAQSNIRAALSDALSRAVRRAWEMDAWFPWTVEETRFYRPVWSAATPYTLDAEVYYNQSYWKALAANTNVVPGSAPAIWEAITTPTTLPLFAPDYDPIGKLIAVMDERRREYPYQLRGDNILLLDGGPALPILLWIRPAPRFASSEWSATTAYSLDDIILATDGNCYRALTSSTNISPVGNAAYWELQTFPEILENYAIYQAYSQSLETDGQTERAMTARSLAELTLEEEIDKIVLLQNQYRRFHVQYR